MTSYAYVVKGDQPGIRLALFSTWGGFANGLYLIVFAYERSHLQNRKRFQHLLKRVIIVK